MSVAEYSVPFSRSAALPLHYSFSLSYCSIRRIASAIWVTMHIKLSLIVHFPNTKWRMHTFSTYAHRTNNAPTQSFHHNSLDGNLQRNSSYIGFCLDHHHANSYKRDICPGSKRKINTHRCQCHIGRHLSNFSPSLVSRYLKYV